MADEVAKPSELVKVLEYALTRLFGDHVPPYISHLVGALLLAVVICAVAVAILIALAKAKDIWIEKFRPLSYSPEEKKRSRDSRLFANHVLREINQRNLSENWKDEEFAELEAEVEAEGQRRYLLPFRDLLRIPSGVRREPSLTRALERSSERLILLEGDPGSGKSVALRHVAQNIANRASGARQSNSILPIFVNLKELRCEQAELVDRDLIRNFILRSLNRINDRFVDEFLDAEFDRGLLEGRWVFLFDSFDEIPAVLSSTEADVVIQKYSQAISDFLGGLNSCRGVVASRFYRGPSQAGWQKFRILDLSLVRQEDLIEKSLLSPMIATRLRGDLALANNDIQSMAKNPMLLGLLCEHMRLGHNFPTLAYEVFEKYFSYRFRRDAERVKQRYDLLVGTIQEDAEQLAFAMASSSVLGLSPSRKLLHHTLREMGTKWTEKRLDRLLDALEYMKIGRGDRDGVSASDRQFTFAHRRFQEYFATCIVVRNPEVVPLRRLLLDARWRETAVVLCQTGRPEAVNSLLGEALDFILKACEQLDLTKKDDTPKSFVWPDAVLHVLSILQAGFGASKRELPEDLRQAAAQVVETATSHGSLLDQKLALEVAGVAPQSTLLELIRGALRLDSPWLNDVTYRQVARLSSIPSDIQQWVRTAVLRMALDHGSQRKRDALHAHLSRLDGSSDLLLSLRLAYSIRTVDLLITLGIVAYSYTRSIPFEPSWLIRIIIFISVVGSHFMIWRFYDWRALFLSAIALRGYVLWLLAAATGGGPFSPASVLALYGLAWPVAAIDCVKRGILNNVAYWPFIPIISLVRPGYLEILRRLIESPWRLLSLAAYLAFLASLFLTERTSYQKIIETVMAGVGIAAGGIFSLAIVCICAISVFRAIRDYLTFSRFKKCAPNNLQLNELISHYKSLSTGLFRFRLLNVARVEGLLSQSSDLVPLQDFARSIADGSDLEPSSARNPFLDVLWTWVDLPISGYRAECRDEIYILLEDITRSRFDSQGAAQRAV